MTSVGRVGMYGRICVNDLEVWALAVERIGDTEDCKLPDSQCSPASAV